MVTAVAAEADSVGRGLTGWSGPVAVPAAGPYRSGTPSVRRYDRALPPPDAAPRAVPGSAPPAGSPARAQHTVDVLAGGVGPAAAAAATATVLAAAPVPYDLVISAGIGGGFAPGAPLGSVVVADALVAADLGAGTPDGYLAVEELGFGRSVHLPPPGLPARFAAVLAAGGLSQLVAPVLTVSTVTGTAARAAELAARHPRAAAEAMEGFGVAEAAALHGVPVAELRAVSNAIGPRDRAAWRIGPALDALRYAFELLSGTVLLAESPTDLLSGGSGGAGGSEGSRGAGGSGGSGGAGGSGGSGGAGGSGGPPGPGGPEEPGASDEFGGSGVSDGPGRPGGPGGSGAPVPPGAATSPTAPVTPAAPVTPETPTTPVSPMTPVSPTPPVTSPEERL